jgi:hypothetical protein
MRFFDNADQLTGKAGYLRAGFTAKSYRTWEPAHPASLQNFAEMEIEDGAQRGARTAQLGAKGKKKKLEGKKKPGFHRVHCAAVLYRTVYPRAQGKKDVPEVKRRLRQRGTQHEIRTAEPPAFQGPKRINKYYFVAGWSRRGREGMDGSKVWGRKLHGFPIHQNEQEPYRVREGDMGRERRGLTP